MALTYAPVPAGRCSGSEDDDIMYICVISQSHLGQAAPRNRERHIVREAKGRKVRTIPYVLIQRTDREQFSGLPIQLKGPALIAVVRVLLHATEWCACRWERTNVCRRGQSEAANEARTQVADDVTIQIRPAVHSTAICRSRRTLAKVCCRLIL